MDDDRLAGGGDAGGPERIMLGSGKGAWIETLFDPNHPNLFLITLPSLALFALGMRRGAAVWLFSSLIIMFLRRGI